MAKNVRFVRTTKKKWLDRDIYDPFALYFCEDTGEVFKGESILTDGIRIVSTYVDLPEYICAADGVLYYVEDTKSGYVLNKTRDDWCQIIFEPALVDIDDKIIENIKNNEETKQAIIDVVGKIDNRPTWGTF